MKKYDESDWLVSDKYCKGCIYYSFLGSGSYGRFCGYTYFTGKIRINPPCKCEVKTKKGKKPNRPYTGTTGIIQK